MFGVDLSIYVTHMNMRMVMSPRRHKRGIMARQKTQIPAREMQRLVAAAGRSWLAGDGCRQDLILTSSSFEELLFYLYRPMIKRKDKSEERVALAYP